MTRGGGRRRSSNTAQQRGGSSLRCVTPASRALPLTQAAGEPHRVTSKQHISGCIGRLPVPACMAWRSEVHGGVHNATSPWSPLRLVPSCGGSVEGQEVEHLMGSMLHATRLIYLECACGSQKPGRIHSCHVSTVHPPLATTVLPLFLRAPGENPRRGEGDGGAAAAEGQRHGRIYLLERN